MSRSPSKSIGVELVRLGCVLILSCLLLLSCATVPPPEEPTQWLDLLPPLTGDSIYLYADVAATLPLLEQLAVSAAADGGKLEKIAGRVSHIHARIGFSPGEIPAFSLIALGKLSPGQVALKLNSDPAWQRFLLEPWPDRGRAGSHWSYRTYWRREGLEIAAPRRAVVLVTGGDPSGVTGLLRRLHSPGSNPLPAEALRDLEGGDLFLFVPDPGGLAASSRPVSSGQDPGVLLQKLPIRRLWFSARRLEAASAPEGYELRAVFLLSEADNPRSVEMLLRLMLTLWIRKAQVQDPVAKLKAASIRSEGETARIESLVLTAGELAALIQALLPETISPGGWM